LALFPDRAGFFQRQRRGCYHPAVDLSHRNRAFHHTAHAGNALCGIRFFRLLLSMGCTGHRSAHKPQPAQSFVAFGTSPAPPAFLKGRFPGSFCRPFISPIPFHTPIPGNFRKAAVLTNFLIFHPFPYSLNGYGLPDIPVKRKTPGPPPGCVRKAPAFYMIFIFLHTVYPISSSSVMPSK
jgi:hypothetical protein